MKHNKINKKYELVADDAILLASGTLYRIRALRDFFNVKAGDLGGYIQSEENLSHEGDCWVSDESMVFDEAQVLKNAQIYGNVSVGDQSEITDESCVGGYVRVSGSSKISEGTFIYAMAPDPGPSPTSRLCP